MSAATNCDTPVDKEFPLSSPSEANRWKLLIKNFRRMKAGYLFLKIYGISNFTWERKKLGQMWRSWWPSQIRYNLVILRMFEIQAGPDWIYILLAGFLTPPPPLPPPTSQPFLYFSPKMPLAILHIFHMSGTSFSEKWEIWNRQHKELDLSELLSVAISITQVLKLNYKQTNKGPPAISLLLFF